MFVPISRQFLSLTCKYNLHLTIQFSSGSSVLARAKLSKLRGMIVSFTALLTWCSIGEFRTSKAQLQWLGVVGESSSWSTQGERNHAAQPGTESLVYHKKGLAQQKRKKIKGKTESVISCFCVPPTGRRNCRRAPGQVRQLLHPDPWGHSGGELLPTLNLMPSGGESVLPQTLAVCLDAGSVVVMMHRNWRHWTQEWLCTAFQHDHTSFLS